MNKYNLPDIDINVDEIEYKRRNKYLNIYIKLIERCLNMNEDELSGYNEIHHILPKSFGGSDNSSNLVTMPVRYHIMAHILLTEIYPDNIKVILALSIIITGKKGSVFTKERLDSISKHLSSRTIAYLREKIHNSRVGIKLPKETKDKMKLSAKRGKDNRLSRRVIGPDGKEYESLHIAALENNIPYSTMTKWLSKSRSTSTTDNHNWRYLTENGVDYLDRIGGKSSSSKKIINTEGTIFNSIVEASQDCQIPYTTLRYWLSGRTRDNHGWKYYENN